MRLLPWPRRRPEPVGRHSRPLTGVAVPGAAASLVSSAATAESVLAGAGLAARADASDRAHPSPAVTLGFSDGASVELDPDDPRVRTFRAAADALLDAPHV